MRRLASGLLLGVLALACSNVRAPEEETREPARRASQCLSRPSVEGTHLEHRGTQVDTYQHTS